MSFPYKESLMAPVGMAIQQSADDQWTSYDRETANSYSNKEKATLPTTFSDDSDSDIEPITPDFSLIEQKDSTSDGLVSNLRVVG